MKTVAITGHRLLETVALAWSVGLAIYTTVYFVAYMAGVSPAGAVLPALIVAILAVVGGAFALHTARRAEEYSADRGVTAVVLAGLFVTAFQVGISAWMGFHSQLRFWDAWFVWAVKARMFAFNGPPAGYFRGSLGPVAHPDYPLNFVLAEASLFRVPGQLGSDLASLVGPACFAALAILFYTGLARLYGRDRAALATALLALVPELPKWAGLGYADVPLALYGGASALYLVLWWRERRHIDLILMGLMAGGAVWTKKEGLPIATLVILAFAVGEALQPAALVDRLSNLILAVGATVAIPLPWLIFTRNTRPLSTDFWPITPAVFRAHSGRLPHILSYFGKEMLTLSHWSLFWFALGAVIVLAGLYRLSRSGWLLLGMFCAQLGVYAFSFVFSYWTPYTAHITTSLDRLLLHAVPWAVLFIAEATQSLSPARVRQESRSVEFQLAH